MNTIKSLWNTISRNSIFIIALIFLIPMCYLLYKKYYVIKQIKEGMGEGRLKDIIRKIALDKHKNATDANKLIAIQNLLLVSSEKIPTDDSINAKRAMVEISGLPKNVQEEKMKTLGDKVDTIYPYLKEVYPQFDMNFWKNILTSSIKQNTSTSTSKPTSRASNTAPSSLIKYTFIEKIYSVVNNDKLEDSVKIKIIIKLTKPSINLLKTAKKLGGGVFKKALSLLKRKNKKTQNGGAPSPAPNTAPSPAKNNPRKKRK
jgi:hypothetical protein